MKYCLRNQAVHLGEIAAVRICETGHSFAKRIQIVPSAASEILNGNREITPRMADKILRGLQIDPITTKSILDRLVRTRSIIKDHKEIDFHKLEMDHFHVIADWYYFAILSLAETDDFQDDPAWIARRLNIGRDEAVQALNRLERIGLLVRANGRLAPTGKQYQTSSDIWDVSIKKNHAQGFVLAETSLLHDPVEIRDFSAATLAIDPELLPEAKMMIQDFRRRLSRFLESGKKKEVYRFSAQLFPVSQRENK